MSRTGKPPGAFASRVAPALGVVFGLHITVSSFLLLRLIVSLRGVDQLKRASVSVDEPGWAVRLAFWRARLGIARPVRLLRSAGVRVPLVLGWFRPAIIVPVGEGDTGPTPESRIDAVLLHELAHLRRGDDGWNLLQQFVRVMYWPHPLSWPIERIIADVREQACDDLCVR
jgi:beta-lactamase regulating signal transducer with metallopeptidase domain